MGLCVPGSGGVARSGRPRGHARTGRAVARAREPSIAEGSAGPGRGPVPGAGAGPGRLAGRPGRRPATLRSCAPAGPAYAEKACQSVTRQSTALFGCGKCIPGIAWHRRPGVEPSQAQRTPVRAGALILLGMPDVPARPGPARSRSARLGRSGPSRSGPAAPTLAARRPDPRADRRDPRPRARDRPPRRRGARSPAPGPHWLRTAHRGQARRRDGRHRPLPVAGRLRPPQRLGAAAGLVGQHRAPSPEPDRQPPAQRRPPPDRDHPAPAGGPGQGVSRTSPGSGHHEDRGDPRPSSPDQRRSLPPDAPR